MPTTGFTTGPFALTESSIKANVTKVSPGAYALGKIDASGTFIVSYVGRSDTDLGNRLKNWIGKYQHFKGAYYSTPKDAFQKECYLFHEFGGTSALHNEVHPARPANSNAACPHCNIFG